MLITSFAAVVLDHWYGVQRTMIPTVGELPSLPPFFPSHISYHRYLKNTGVYRY
jgi:hypothetical protein